MQRSLRRAWKDRIHQKWWMHALWASSKVYHYLFSMHRGFEKLGGLDCSAAQAPQCDEWPRTHCVESKCRNRSIDHVSVSLVVDDVAVEEFVGPVESLWSLLSWLDADCE